MKLKDIGAKGPTKKGLSRSPLYTIWRFMLERCCVESDPAYKNYGGRGIKVCDRWFNFEDFHNDNIDLHDYGLEMDRIDNDGNYSPGNLRWVTKSKNCRNRRNTIMATIDGITKPLIDWSEHYKIKHTLVSERINQHGWEVKRALTTPVADKKENMILTQKKRWENHIKAPKKKPKTNRKIRTVEYKGETMTIKQLSDIVSVSTKLLSKRLFERGWSLDRAVINRSFNGCNQFTME